MKTIGVFFGSGSPEHDVSIITAQLAISTLKKLGHKVVPVYITKTGKWMIGEELGSIKMFADPESPFTKQSGDLRKFNEYYLDLEESAGKLVFKKKGLMGSSVQVDIAFPALHGSFGEDGTIQGLFEMFGVPYVGCDVPSSAIAMDKALTKMVMEQHHIPTTKFVYFFRRDWEENKSAVLGRVKQELKFPVFIKPVHLGSSIGISKIKSAEGEELEQKIEVALHYDGKVLVEEGVENVMDVTCCLLGNETPKASVLQESVFSNDLFDFDEKYLKEGGAQTGSNQNGLIIPARLSEDVTRAIQGTAKEVFKALGCSGIARVDFLVDKQTGMFYANEVNPMPGTLYHHLWKASGMEVDQEIIELLELAEKKHEERRKITYTFESNILKQVNSSKLGSKKLQ